MLIGYKNRVNDQETKYADFIWARDNIISLQDAGYMTDTVPLLKLFVKTSGQSG